MKIAIITDTHFGARSDNIGLRNKMLDFFETVFFPTLEKHNITHIIHIGDFFDKRKNINVDTLREVNKHIIPKFNQYNTHIVIGNHDTYFKNTNRVNSVSEILGNQYENISVYEETTDIKIGDTSILLIPWINGENRNETLSHIDSSTATYAFGHLEVNGFSYHGDIVCSNGLSRDTFTTFKKVFSGHFHEKSTKGNISYVGSPYAMNWSEHSSKHGFHLLDLDSGRTTFYENKIYTHKLIRVSEFDIDNPPVLESCYVKVIVNEDISDDNLEHILKVIKNTEPYEVKVVHTFNNNVSEININENDYTNLSTFDFIINHIKNSKEYPPTEQEVMIEKLHSMKEELDEQ